MGELGGSAFEGIPAAELAAELARLECREYPAGATLIQSGALTQREMFVIEAGYADVFVTDRRGHERRVGTDGPGVALGEMALFTGQPASATVRASTDLRVHVLSAEDLHRVAAAHPSVYRNLGAMLAGRLAQSHHREANAAAGRITLLHDQGAPSLLGFALCASVAWHTRRPALLLILSEAPPAALTALPGSLDAGALLSGERRFDDARATVALVRPEGLFSPQQLGSTLARLSESFDHLLVQTAASAGAATLGARTLRLLPVAAATDGAVRGSGMAVRAWVDAAPSLRVRRDGLHNVPPLTGIDEQNLRAGVLPACTPAARALGWVARDLAELRVGLALGSGAVRGYAHFGALKVLQSAGVPVDYIAGTSIGAAVAALFAAGFSAEESLAAMDLVGSMAFRPTLSAHGLLSSRGLRAGLRRVAGADRIEDLPVPLAIVAVDLLQRREIVFKRGLVWPAVLASMSIPGIYAPLRLGGLTLVDGGVLNPVPASVVAGMGASRVIGVSLATRPLSRAAEPHVAAGVSSTPSVLQSIIRTFELMQAKIGDTTAASAEILIEPSFDPDEGWGLRNFRQGRRFVAAGEAAAQIALPALATALPWLRPL